MADDLQLAKYGNITVPIGSFGGLGDAIKTGVQLAQHERQLNQQKQAIDVQTQSHKLMAADKFIDVMTKAAKVKNSAVRKSLFETGKQIAPMFGVTVGPGFLDSLQVDDDRMFNALIRVQNDKSLLNDPEMAKAYADAIQSGNYADTVEQLNKIDTLHNRIKVAELEAVSRNYEGTQNRNARKEIADVVAETTRRGQDLTAQSRADETKRRADSDAATIQLKAALGGADIVNPETGLVDPTKVIAAAQKIGQQKADESAAKVDNTVAKTGEAKVRTEELPKSNAEKVRHNKATEAETAAYHQGLLAAKKYGLNLSGARLDVAKDRLDRTDHRTNIQNLKKDPQITERLRQYSNLGVSLSQIADAKTLTPQQIDEFQQAVRSNLGIKGTGGVDERTKTYINSLGLSAERVAQFVTGEPASIAKDSAIVKHFQDLARLERKNIGQILDKRIEAASGGFASMYKRRPDLRADLLSEISSVKTQYQGPETAGPAARPNFSPQQIQLMIQKGGAPYTRQYLKGKGYSDQEITGLGVQ